MIQKPPLEIVFPRYLDKTKDLRRFIVAIMTAYQYHRISIEDLKAFMLGVEKLLKLKTIDYDEWKISFEKQLAEIQGIEVNGVESVEVD